MELQGNSIYIKQALEAESVENAFYALDNEWNFAYADIRASSFFSKNTELKGKNIWKEFPELVEKPLFQNFQKAIRRNRPVRFEEFSPVHKAWFEITAYPKINGLEIHIYNINSIKKKEKEKEDLLSKVGLFTTLLQESESQLKLIMNSVPLPLAYVESSGTYNMVNTAYSELFKQAENEILGKKVKEIYSAENYKKLADSIKSVLSGKEAVCDTSMVMNKKEYGCQVLFMPDIKEGQVKGYIEIFILKLITKANV